MAKHPNGKYSDIWDTYVTEGFQRVKGAPAPADRALHRWQVLNTRDRSFQWPGDEWGSTDDVRCVLDACVFPFIDRPDPHLVELGTGAGRYTEQILDRYDRGRISAFDVSQKFLDQLGARCATAMNAGRLELTLLDDDPMQIVKTLGDYAGTVDAMVSFDAMVHVDLHTLVMYWICAARLLREGGYVVMSLADCMTENGLLKLVFDSPGVYRLKGAAGPHFQWTSANAVCYLLGELGFDILQASSLNGRDNHVVAKLSDRSKHRALLDMAGLAI